MVAAVSAALLRRRWRGAGLRRGLAAEVLLYYVHEGEAGAYPLLIEDGEQVVRLRGRTGANFFEATEAFDAAKLANFTQVLDQLLLDVGEGRRLLGGELRGGRRLEGVGVGLGGAQREALNPSQNSRIDIYGFACFAGAALARKLQIFALRTRPLRC